MDLGCANNENNDDDVTITGQSEALSSSTLLGKLRRFLPRIAAANAALPDALSPVKNGTMMLNNGNDDGTTNGTAFAPAVAAGRGDGLQRKKQLQTMEKAEQEIVTVQVIDSDDDEDEEEGDSGGSEGTDDDQFDDAEERNGTKTMDTEQRGDGAAAEALGNVEGGAKTTKRKQFIQFDTILYKIDDGGGDDNDSNGGTKAEKGQHQKQMVVDIGGGNGGEGEPMSKKKYLIFDTTETAATAKGQRNGGSDQKKATNGI